MHGDPIKTHFNRAAPHYNSHCKMQIYAGDKLIKFTQIDCDTPQYVMDLGCGTGITTEKLAANFAFKELHAIDIAEECLRQARLRLANKKIKIYATDFDYFPEITQKFDLIFANLALHWSKDFGKLLKKISALLSTNGYLAFSIPLTKTFHELNGNFEINHFQTAETVNQILQSQPLKLVNFNEETHQIDFESTHDLLLSIKNTGTNYVSNRMQKGLRGKVFLNKNITQLTYHLGFFIAKKELLR